MEISGFWYILATIDENEYLSWLQYICYGLVSIYCKSPKYDFSAIALKGESVIDYYERNFLCKNGKRLQKF